MSHLSDFIATTLTDTDKTKLVPLSLLDGFNSENSINATNLISITATVNPSVFINNDQYYNPATKKIYRLYTAAGRPPDDVSSQSTGKFFKYGDQFFTYSTQLDLLGSNTGRIELSGTNYAFVQGKGNPSENSLELQYAYNDLAERQQGMGSDRYTLIVAPGIYTFGTTKFQVNTPYIDIVSLTGNADILIDGINVTANDVFIKGIDVGSLPFTIATNLNLLRCENCKGGEFSFGFQLHVSGTFKNCTGGDSSFGNGGIFSGFAEFCVGGDSSFGAGGGTFSGNLHYCRLTVGSFSTAYPNSILYCINAD